MPCNEIYRSRFISAREIVSFFADATSRCIQAVRKYDKAAATVATNGGYSRGWGERRDSLNTIYNFSSW